MRRKGHELDLIINLIDSLEVHLGLGSLKILDLFDAAARRAGEEKERSALAVLSLPELVRLMSTFAQQLTQTQQRSQSSESDVPSFLRPP